MNEIVKMALMWISGFLMGYGVANILIVLKEAKK